MCDALPYGLDAMLSHQFKDGSERPITYATRTLAPAEAKYSQREKEGLVIVLGVNKFHQYLVGRHITIYSDHKPLQYLLSETRPDSIITNPTVGIDVKWLQLSYSV